MGKSRDLAALIADSKVGSSELVPGAVEGAITAALGGFRNKIINGSMLVAQRGSVAMNATSFPTYGGADRWQLNASSFTTIASTIVRGGTLGNTWTTSGYVQQLTATTTGSGSIQFRQAIEAANTACLNGKTITISAKVAHDVGSNVTATIQLFKANSVDNFSGVTAISTSVATASVASSTYGTTTTTLSGSVTLGSTDASNGLLVFVQFSSVGAVTSKNFAVGDFQLEAGSVATPFETRAYGQELELCQRYAQVLQQGGTGRAETTTKMDLSCQFITSMRTTPSASIIGTLKMRDLTSGTTRTAVTPGAITVSSGTASGAYMEFTPASWTAANFTIGNIATLVCDSGDNGILVTAEL